MNEYRKNIIRRLKMLSICRARTLPRRADGLDPTVPRTFGGCREDALHSNGCRRQDPHRQNGGLLRQQAQGHQCRLIFQLVIKKNHNCDNLHT